MTGMGVGVSSKAKGTAKFISRLANRPLDFPASAPHGRFVANQRSGYVIALSGFFPRPDIHLTGRSRRPRGSGFASYYLVYFLSVGGDFFALSSCKAFLSALSGLHACQTLHCYLDFSWKIISVHLPTCLLVFEREGGGGGGGEE